jgi:signal peptidase I
VEPTPTPKPKTKRGGFIELVLIVAAALSLALATQAWAIKPYKIPSGSMEPTFNIGQRVLANRFIYDFEDPSVGDIIVFHPPGSGIDDIPCGVEHSSSQPCPQSIEEESGETFTKRIVAGPGDKLSIHNGHPVVNGVENKDEPYTYPCPTCNLPKPITIPPNEYFLMGDNRGGSYDSRFWGPIPRDWIIGKVFATLWPPDRLGFF